MTIGWTVVVTLQGEEDLTDDQEEDIQPKKKQKMKSLVEENVREFKSLLIS